MKKLFIFVLALGVFVSCKDKKGPMPGNNKDYYKDDYNNGNNNGNNRNNNDDNGNNNRNNNDDENGNNNRNNNRNNNDEPVDDNNNSGSSSWGNANEQTFLNSCVNSAAESGTFTRAQAKTYCSCMLEKLEQKYPDPNDVSGLDENSPVMQNMAKKCVADLQ